MNPKTAGILFLHKDKFDIYVNTNPDIISHHFEPDQITNYNITNKELFQQDIDSFIKKFNLSPGNLIIAIGNDALFYKDFPDPGVKYISQDVNNFIERLPFGSVMTQTTPLADGIRIVAANRELLSFIKKIFEDHGFLIEYILPAFMFGDEIGSSPVLTIQNASVIFRDALKNNTYNFNFELLKDSEEIPEKLQRKKDIMKLYALVSVFGSLVIAFLVIWYINPFPQTYKGKAIIEPTITATPTITYPTIYQHIVISPTTSPRRYTPPK